MDRVTASNTIVIEAPVEAVSAAIADYAQVRPRIQPEQFSAYRLIQGGQGDGTVAAWNPVTTLSDALRELFGNPNTPTAPGDPWSVAHPVAYTWIWIIGLVAICAPLAVRAYQRSIDR